MEFLDIFKEKKDEEVELKPGDNRRYSGYSKGPAERDDGSSDNDGRKERGSSKNREKEARLLPGLGSREGSENKTKNSGGVSREKTLKRVESKMDKIMKQNKMIMEKLEGMDTKSSKSSDENTVW